MINKQHKKISVRRQSQLLSLNRSSLYLVKEAKDDSYLCNMLAEIYSDYPIYGYRRVTAVLRRQGAVVNHKRVQRLMKEMNLQAIYPGPNTSKRLLSDMVYPYLLSSLIVIKTNMVWQVDITYLRTNSGFMYLVALIDVYSRLIMGWRLSNSLCVIACLEALGDAILKYGKPDIINSDRGSQFTCSEWIQSLVKHGITISMTGKGRCNDNANIERLWRSFKYEGSYLYRWYSVLELKVNIPKWVDWYNCKRPHQALGYLTPLEKYCAIVDKPCNLPTILQLKQMQNSDLILEEINVINKG
jgi:putative transposase